MKETWPVLVVDDEPEFLRMLVELLTEEGYVAVGVSNGARGIEKIRQSEYPVVLVDLIMNPVSGEEVIEAAKQHNPLTEVIVITGHPSLRSSMDAIRYQVFDYLRKPIDADRLLRTIDNAIAQYRLSAENKRLVDQLNRQQEVLRSRIVEVSGELEQLSTTDALTGLYNYRFYVEVLHTEISRALRYGRPLTLAMLDLDYFKYYNDTFGHQQGNKALQEISAEMRSTVREVDILIRYGGEEFAILLPETPKERARTIIARVCQRVRDLNFEATTSEGPRVITLSCGLASCPDDASEVESLTTAADLALYRAKSMGRNQIVFYTPALREAQRSHL